MAELHNAENSLLVGDLLNFSCGVIAKAHNTADYTQIKDRIRAQEKALVERASGCGKGRALFLTQEHGDRIIEAVDYGQGSCYSAGEADAIVTRLPGLACVIRTADCIPVFIFDEINMALGAIHSGWRGTRLKISRRAVSFMSDKYGSDPRDLRAYILPGIGPESYEVNLDVAGLFDDCIIRRDGKIYLDLWGYIEKTLIEVGIIPEHIINFRICTLAQNNIFFSHRAGDSGRNLNWAMINPQ
jgi:hypothetical protein